MKTTKLQTLTENLAVAQKALAEAEARLQPQIAAEQVVVDQLRTAYDKTIKASSKTYEAWMVARRDASARLFPAETTRALREAIKAKISAQFPNADIARLANEIEGKKLSADAEVVAAEAAYRSTNAAYEKASRAWNVASSPGGKLSKLRYELEKFQDVVTKLEKEIERLPVYRQNAKDRRDDEKREALVAAETQAARELLGDL